MVKKVSVGNEIRTERDGDRCFLLCNGSEVTLQEGWYVRVVQIPPFLERKCDWLGANRRYQVRNYEGRLYIAPVGSGNKLFFDTCVAGLKFVVDLQQATKPTK